MRRVQTQIVADTSEFRRGLSIAQARAKLAGWHFAQESLTKREREILGVGEMLMRILDDEAADGWRAA